MNSKAWMWKVPQSLFQFFTKKIMTKESLALSMPIVGFLVRKSSIGSEKFERLTWKLEQNSMERLLTRRKTITIVRLGKRSPTSKQSIASPKKFNSGGKKWTWSLWGEGRARAKKCVNYFVVNKTTLIKHSKFYLSWKFDSIKVIFHFETLNYQCLDSKNVDYKPAKSFCTHQTKYHLFLSKDKLLLKS
jgi:hypothetical protein